MLTDLELVTIGIAVYGAILSSILAASRLSENRRRLKVELSIGLTTRMIDGPEEVLFLCCSNTGKRPIELNSYGIELPNEKTLIFENQSPQRFPISLKDGQGCTLWQNLGQISRTMAKEGLSGLVHLRGMFKDATGKRYRSKKFEFDPTTWKDH